MTCVGVCRLLQDILRYIHSVARCVEENAGKPTAKFWRVLLNKAYDVLDKVCVLGKKYLSRIYTQVNYLYNFFF